MPAARLGRRFLVLAVLFASTALLPPAVDAAPVPLMRSRDLRPGMKGYGLTVFRGTRVVRFPIVVLGVLHHFLAESDLILIRVTGGYPAQHGVGIIAGMSGSPVYVDGRLIGAVAYGWPFSKEPVGGVTPIESMLKELPGRRPPPEAGVSTAPESRTLGRALAIGGRSFRRVQVMRNDDPAVRHAAPDTMVLTPVPSLLQIRGFGARAVSRLVRILKPLDMEPLRTFETGGPVPKKVPRLQPGSAVGVELLTGDLDISGTGTLTWTDRKRFLAFGHPMAQMGQVSFPLTAAYIQDVLPSYLRPFKFASQIAAVGELSTDRFWAVGGWLGRKAPMVPVRIHVDDRIRGIQKTYRLKAAQNRSLTGPILTAAVAQAVGSTAPESSDCTAILHYRVRPHDRDPITLDQMVSSPMVDVSSALQVADTLGQITGNDFEPLPVDGLDLDVELVPGRRTATIERVYAARGDYRPGEEMAVHVVLKPYGRPSVERVVRLPIPADLEKGPIMVGVAGGSDMAALRKRLVELRSEPTSLDEVLEQLRTDARGQDLVIRAAYPTEGATVGAERFPFLPEALRDILPGLHQSDIASAKDFIEKRIVMPWVVRGTEVIQEDLAGAAPAAPKPHPVPLPGPLWEAPASPRLELQSGRSLPRLIVTSSSPFSAAHEASSGSVHHGGHGPPEKLLPSGTRRFDLSGAAKMARGTFEATSLSESGELALAPSVQSAGAAQGDVLWSLAADRDGRSLLAGGTHGVVLGWSPGETRARSRVRVHDMAVTAVARTAGGLMIGTAPHGRIYFQPDGQPPERIHDGPERYVWAFLPRPDGSVLAATGDPAVLYRVAPDGSCRWVAALPVRHVRALAAASDGAVYVATANPGGVYVLAPDGGDPQPLFSTAYASADALVVEPNGTVAAASGKSIYLWKPDRHLQEVEVADHPLLALALDADGSLLAGGGGGELYRVGSDGATSRLLETNDGAITSLCRAGDQVAAATAGPGRLLRLAGSTAGMGSWISPVLDAGSVAHWGRVRWMADPPGSGMIRLQARSGFTPQPDASWSPWSSDLVAADGESIPSPPARYLQVRVQLSPSGARSPRVGDLAVYFRDQERDPVVAVEKPAGGERLSGTVKLQWKVTGSTPGSLAYNLAYSADGDKSWKPIKSNLLPSLKEVAGGGADERGAPVESDEYSWDTSHLPDGTYVIRVDVLDRRHQPATVRASAVSDAVVLANTDPTISILSHQKMGDGMVIHGLARSHLAWIVSVAWRQGKGDWQVASPDNGLFDSDREAFTITAPGHDEVEIKVTDEAGNTKTIKQRP